MSDNVYTVLTVLTNQAEDVEEILVHEDAANQVIENNEYTEFHYEEVNAGDLEFLTQLRKAGIAFNSNWDAGAEFGAGTQYGRFTPEGEYVEKFVYDLSINPDLSEMMVLLDSPEELRTFIQAHHDKVTPLPLDEKQVEYGKRYRAIQLIAPKE